MFALVALSVALAALSPMLAKKLSPTVQSTSSNSVIKTDECKTLINQNCNLCNVQTAECLGCEIEPSSCISGKKLNYEKCICE